MKKLFQMGAFLLLLTTAATLFLMNCSKDDSDLNLLPDQASGSRLKAVQAPNGYGSRATGGAGGTSVTVNNLTDFKKYAESSSAYIITVSGTINIGSGSKVKVLSKKTIKGANTSAKIIGNLDCGGSSNIIIQNLTITNPGGDGITLWTTKDVYITKCTVYDCGDGCIDVSQNSDNITISWCKFYYTSSSAAHRFVSICGNVTPAGYHVTYHHNWFAQNCDQRMPSGSYCRAHLYNNYFSCTGNSYCSNVRTGGAMRADRNYYDKVNNPLYKEDNGLIWSYQNKFNSCTGKAYTGRDANVFTPPYSFTMDATDNVPSIVKAGAGNI